MEEKKFILARKRLVEGDNGQRRYAYELEVGDNGRIREFTEVELKSEISKDSELRRALGVRDLEIYAAEWIDTGAFLCGGPPLRKMSVTT